MVGIVILQSSGEVTGWLTELWFYLRPVVGLVAIVGPLVALISWGLRARRDVDKLEKRVDELREDQQRELDQLRDTIDDRLEDREEAVDGQIEALDDSVDDRIDSVRSFITTEFENRDTALLEMNSLQTELQAVKRENFAHALTQWIEDNYESTTGDLERLKARRALIDDLGPDEDGSDDDTGNEG